MVPKFEKAIISYCGTKFAVAVSNATAALHLACRALGLSQGDILWTSPITFVASANSGLYCGAQVDFVDIDPKTYNMNPSALQEKLERSAREGCLPKIVMPVHLCGQSCDMRSIAKLGQEYGFKIIEDASHAVGGQFEERNVSDCRLSDVAVFSFHPVKNFTTAEGGAALTNDERLAERMRCDRSHGIKRTEEKCDAEEIYELWNYKLVQLGFNYRMNDLQAALGISQLEQLDGFVKQRRSIAHRYDELLSEFPIGLPWQDPATRSPFHLYPIRIPEERGLRSRNSVYRYCQESGIGVNLHYPPVYRHPYYEALGFKEGHCPEAEKYFREAISLPIFPALTEEEQLRVVTTLSECVS